MNEVEKQALISDKDLKDMIKSTSRLKGWENVSSALKELQANRKASRKPEVACFLNVDSENKTFVVKLPNCVDDLHGIGLVMSAEDVIKAIKATGGSVEDE